MNEELYLNDRLRRIIGQTPSGDQNYCTAIEGQYDIEFGTMTKEEHDQLMKFVQVIYDLGLADEVEIYGSVKLYERFWGGVRGRCLTDMDILLMSKDHTKAIWFEIKKVNSLGAERINRIHNQLQVHQEISEKLNLKKASIIRSGDIDTCSRLIPHTADTIFVQEDLTYEQISTMVSLIVDGWNDTLMDVECEPQPVYFTSESEISHSYVFDDDDL